MLAAFEIIGGRRDPLTRVAAARNGAKQAGARPNGTAEASVLGPVDVLPLPAGVLAGAHVDVTGRRQGGRDLFACSRDGHCDSWTWVGGAAVVWQ